MALFVDRGETDHEADRIVLAVAEFDRLEERYDAEPGSVDGRGWTQWASAMPVR